MVGLCRLRDTGHSTLVPLPLLFWHGILVDLIGVNNIGTDQSSEDR